MEQILNAPAFLQQLNAIAAETGQSKKQVHADAKEYLKELYTEHKPVAEILGSQVGQYLLSRAYEKTIDVDIKQLKQLARLMRKHPVAFVMTHKTYIDMLVLAVVLYRHGLPIPYTFAGINMAFPGLAQFGRQAGVIFIRRSFKDNPTYKATLRFFIQSLVDQRGHFMWALEGTRSRTGKLVWPKMGILKYIMEAEEHSYQEVKYVPVSIVYDLIPDVKDMTEELKGKSKKPESLTWFLQYLQKMGEGFGRASVRIGEPIAVKSASASLIPEVENNQATTKPGIPHLAFNLVHGINQATPVTSTSLICISLLSHYALSKKGIEHSVAELMQFVEQRRPGTLVDRGRAVGESVQQGLNLLTRAGIVRQNGESLKAKYTIAPDQFMQATYYGNMAVHQLYRRAFIELALVLVSRVTKQKRLQAFWEQIMVLRDLFKFEFFYSGKPTFSDEIEADLQLVAGDIKSIDFLQSRILPALKKQEVLVSPAVLYTYIEAYRVVGQALLDWDSEYPFDESEFLAACHALGGEMQWQGKIQRLESVSKPFLENGLRLAKNRNLIPDLHQKKQGKIRGFIDQLERMAEAITKIQSVTLSNSKKELPVLDAEQHIVPGSRTEAVTKEVFEGESGAHIGAFFDLDRTLIKGFSAKEFFQARLLSGKMTTNELVAQFAGVITFAAGNGNFANLAAVGAKGVRGVKEQVFIDVGEDVYLKHLADAIYPESRALVAAHLAKGHTVAIVSAATPYQVNPIARDLGIDHVMCTRLELKKGVFTGNIVEPACWGDGKAHAAKMLTERFNLDLQKSYFYTDSAEDMPLLDIVGYPRPLNPDPKLSAAAFQNNWPVYRFDDEKRTGVSNIARTFLAAGTLIPAVINGVMSGASSMSWREGVNSMTSTVGDLGLAMAGIQLLVKNEEHLWNSRPAVFLFNHQSSADLFIVARLIRKDATAIAKKELRNVPLLGQMMEAAGVIFLDRSNREKAIEAMKPAVDALKRGTSIAIAPEGTRSKGYEIGKFKKGAFHLAMQAGVPVVPIVIKNAHDAMPKGSSVFKPSTIEVVILPPVPTKKWKLKDLNKNIDKVRKLYLQELGQDE